MYNDAGASSRESRKRQRSGDGEEAEVPIGMPLHTEKRRRKVRDSGGGYDEESEVNLEMFKRD